MPSTYHRSGPPALIAAYTVQMILAHLDVEIPTEVDMHTATMRAGGSDPDNHHAVVTATWDLPEDYRRAVYAVTLTYSGITAADLDTFDPREAAEWVQHWVTAPFLTPADFEADTSPGETPPVEETGPVAQESPVDVEPPRVVLVVDYLNGHQREFQIDPAQGWKLNTLKRTISLRHQPTGYTFIPLDTVASFDLRVKR